MKGNRAQIGRCSYRLDVTTAMAAGELDEVIEKVLCEMLSPRGCVVLFCLGPLVLGSIAQAASELSTLAIALSLASVAIQLWAMVGSVAFVARLVSKHTVLIQLLIALSWITTK